MNALRITTNGFAFGALVSAGVSGLAGTTSFGIAVNCLVAAGLLATVALCWLISAIRGEV